MRRRLKASRAQSKCAFIAAERQSQSACRLKDVELVIEQSMLFRTAVFWSLQEPRDKLVELAVNSLLDSGFLLRDGLERGPAAL